MCCIDRLNPPPEADIISANGRSAAVASNVLAGRTHVDVYLTVVALDASDPDSEIGPRDALLASMFIRAPRASRAQDHYRERPP